METQITRVPSEKLLPMRLLMLNMCRHRPGALVYVTIYFSNKRVVAVVAVVTVEGIVIVLDSTVS